MSDFGRVWLLDVVDVVCLSVVALGLVSVGSFALVGLLPGFGASILQGKHFQQAFLAAVEQILKDE